ncbi:glutamate 5-kinase [Nocardioides sp.]|uniref:glutamate 5-kinase n=1 Tax=Nocardioides sp. TaxID=35761 RepID=UPI003D0DC7A8
MSREGLEHRSTVSGARRIVVKVGSSSLTTAAGGIDPSRISRLVDVLASVRSRGAEVVLVSSGAIAAGLAPLGLRKRPRALPAQQAAASVGQGLLVHRYTEELARHGLVTGQVLLTVDDVVRRAHYRNAHQTFAKLLELGVLPIVNENDTVATSEIRFGDNDRLAALVAHLVHADLLVLLSDVDGLYDGHPTHDGTRLIAEVRGNADLAGVRTTTAGAAGVGTGGMSTKVDAARIATGAGIPVVLTSADQASAALAGDPVGTLFHPTGKRRPTRLLWLAHATEPKGQLVLDGGAVKAVTERRASLLAAGVTAVRGSFVAGDPIDLLGPDGTTVARGLVNFDADELPGLLGRSSHELKRELGAAYERELVHRDDLIVL